LEVTGPDQVWCSDITYVPMATGFMYLVAVMDWWSRYVLGWLLEIPSHPEHQLSPSFAGALFHLRHKRTPHADLAGEVRPRDALAPVHR
jgi:transposase InsO family protein